MVEHEVKEQLREWIATTNGSIQPHEISDDLALLTKNIISSLQLMELVQLIEKLSGNRVSVERLKPENFNTLAMIYQSFFVQQAS